MQYDSYENKIAKVERILKLIFKHMTKILISAGVVFATVIALLATKGIIVSAKSCPLEITYGEELDYKANAFMSGVEYEFCPINGDEWTTEIPVVPGKYMVRAVAKATIGKRYGDPEIFTIKARAVDVYIDTDSLVYGDMPKVTADLAGEDSIVCENFIYNADRTKVTADVDSITVLNKDGIDVTESYLFTAHESAVVTNPRYITIASSDASKVYDGKPLESDDYSLWYGNLAYGDKLSLKFINSITNIGTVENDFTFAVFAIDGTDVTAFYAVTKELGTLTVTERPISFASQSADYTYDGKAHTLTSVVTLGEGKLADGEELVCEGWTEFFDVGTHDNTFVPKIFNGDQDVTENYQITLDFGKISIAPLKITVKTPSESRVYSADFWGSTNLDKSVLASGDEFSILESTKIKNVGTVENVISFSIICPEREADVTANYDITVENGTLTVEKRKLTVEAHSEEWVYDGDDHYCHGISFSGEHGIVEHHYAKVVDFVTVNGVVSNIENVISVLIYENLGKEEDVTENYDISYKYGTLTVTHRYITVTMGSLCDVYKGEAYRCVDWTAPNIVSGHTVSIIKSTEITNVGIAENECFEYDVLDSYGKSVKGNYIAEFEKGVLEVIARPIILATASDTKVYDATPLTAPSWRISELSPHSLVAGHKVLGATPYGSITTVGEVDNLYSGKIRIFDNDGVDVTRNYAFDEKEIEIGTLTVTKREITVKTGDVFAIYSDKPNSNPTASAVTDGGGYGLCDGHSFLAVNAPSFTDVISDEENVFTVLIKCGTDDVTQNYDIIAYEYGSVKIAPRPITVKTNEIAIFYDSKIHSDSTLTLVVGAGKEDLCEGHYLEITSPVPTFKNICQNEKNEFDFVILKAGADVTHNYAVTLDAGLVNIEPRPITVVTSSIDCVYDDKAHSNSYVRILNNGKSLGLCDGHSVATVTAPQFIDAVTDAKNEVLITIVEGDEDVSENYAITYNYGLVNIAKRQITLVTEGYNAIYDGKTHRLDNITLGENSPYGLCDGHDIHIVSIKLYKNVVTNDENVIELEIRNGDISKNENYEITFVYGIVNIYHRPLSILSGSMQWVYNGKDNIFTDYEIVSGSLAENDTIVVVNSAKIKDVGSAVNKIEIVIYDENHYNTVANYSLTINYGELVVIKRMVNIVSQSASFGYDGKYHTHEKFNCVDGTSIVSSHTVKIIQKTSKRDIGTYDNIVAIAIYDENGNNVTTKNYDVNYPSYGKIQITANGQNPVDPEPPIPPSISSEDPKDFKITSNDANSMEELSEIIAFYITSDTSGTIYFKTSSYGDYTGDGWNAATEYDKMIHKGLSAYYLTSYALENSGAKQAVVVIESVYGKFILPYFSGDKYNIQTSDIIAKGNASYEYTMNYYIWDGESSFDMPDALEDYESEYYKFVRSKYLTLDSETRDFMEEIIEAQGFSRTDSDILNKVATYIQNSAKYNLNYNRALDSSDNIAIAFLDTYREGICQHYATAATLLFRALGMPARYTIGYSASVFENVTTSVSAIGHAWVEVYIEGAGWVPVEVTGDGEGSISEKELNICPDDISKAYDGTPLVHDGKCFQVNKALNNLLKMGYTFEAVVSGERTDVGESQSVIENFILYDPTGKDVTDQFIITKKPGKITIFGQEIEIYIYEKNYEYNGKFRGYNADEFVLLSEYEGMEFVMKEIKISLKDVGLITASYINLNSEKYFDFEIYMHGGTEDCSSNYHIKIVDYRGNENYTILQITTRKITVATASATKPSGGEALKKPEYFLSIGTLAEGHDLYVKVNGSISSQGSTENTVVMDSLLISDEEGNDVTKNYEVDFALGTLTMT